MKKKRTCMPNLLNVTRPMLKRSYSTVYQKTGTSNNIYIKWNERPTHDTI